jgi:putative tryptophan/tyrosine transport system permease protein
VLDILLTAVQVGLLYAPLVLGIYLAMGVLSLPDLTLQGSFGIGGAIAAVLTLHDQHPLLALAAGMVGGAAAGLATGLLHLWLRLNVLLASILVATAAYSVCLVVMGAGNVSLFGRRTVFSWADGTDLDHRSATVVTGIAVTLLLVLAVTWFLRTDYGMSLVAAGQSIQTARGLGIRTETRQLTGLGLANALAGLSGGLVVHNQGFMDVTIQNGIVVIGLAAMMLGLSLTRSPRVLPVVLALVGGVVLYRFAVAASLQLGLDPNLLQLVTAALVVVVIGLRAKGSALARLTTATGRRQSRITQARFYEEDRVASFI